VRYPLLITDLHLKKEAFCSTNSWGFHDAEMPGDLKMLLCDDLSLSSRVILP